MTRILGILLVLAKAAIFAGIVPTIVHVAFAVVALPAEWTVALVRPFQRGGAARIE